MTREKRSQAAFSLLEVLIAAALLLIIALATIPLFTHATQNNLAGSEGSRLSQLAATEAERTYQLGFQHASLQIPTTATEVMSEEVRDEGDPQVLGDETWAAGTPVASTRWWRHVRVRQFSITDLDDGILNTPLPGSTQPIFVHLKEVEVGANSARGGSSEGPGRRIAARFLMAF